jgi:hypothetical protein
MTRRERLEQAFREHGIGDEQKLESHIRGCDLSRPVRNLLLRPPTPLRPGDQFQVWVRDGGTPGKYGAPPGEQPERLGIMIEGRHCEMFEVRILLNVVACTAATFPMGLVERVGGNGGGTQYILPPNWLESVERIS